MKRPLVRYDNISDEIKEIYRNMTPGERLNLLEELNEFTYVFQIDKQKRGF